MNWAENSWLYALSFPVIVALGLVAQRFFRRGGRAVRWPGIKRVLASPDGLKPVPTATSGRRPWLLLIAIVGVIVALARPQWGEIEEPVYDHAREVMIALDLSRSMMVEDVPPSRLVRSRLLVQTLLAELRGERVGLIVFAGTSFVQVPMSSDYQILNEFLPEMDADYMPQGGTDYAGMLKSALEGFSDKVNTDRYLIVLSDGESQTGDWRAHLPQLHERDIRVITLGVGTPGGGFIPDGSAGYKKDERGAVVLSKLEPATLEALATETGGVYRNASSWVDLKALLEETVARGREGSFVEERSVRRVDRFQWFLGPALALALLGLWREISIRPRVRKIRQSPPATPRQTTRKSKMKATAGLSIVLMSFLIGAPRQATGADEPPPPDPTAPVRESVARVSALASPTARDWLEMAENTLVFGTELKTAQQPVPPGPVVDAISAATLGQSINPALTNWTELLANLNELLEPPPEQQQDEQQKQEDEQEDQDQEQSEQEQSQDGDSGENEEQNQENNQQDQPSENEQSESGQQQQDEQQEPNEQQQSGGNENSDQQNSRQGEELGDLEEPEEQQQQAAQPQPQPQSPDEKRKFGGRPAEAAQQPPMDAKTAAAMQKLREVTEGDSPARLFEILEGEQPKQGETGKDW